MVSATAMQNQAEDKIPFTLEKPEFDENTYWGRFEAFRATANPMHAFYTNSRIWDMQKKIKEQE